jgi:hypothetical protein
MRRTAGANPMHSPRRGDARLRADPSGEHHHPTDVESPSSTPSSSAAAAAPPLPGAPAAGPPPPPHARAAAAAGVALRLGPWRGPEVRPELVAISVVYLVQGLLGLSRLAVFSLFKDELGLDPAAVGLLTGLGYAPWLIKPLYGFLSDAVPLWGYRRRSYLVVCGVVGEPRRCRAAPRALVPARPPAWRRQPDNITPAIFLFLPWILSRCSAPLKHRA